VKVGDIIAYPTSPPIMNDQILQLFFLAFLGLTSSYITPFVSRYRHISEPPLLRRTAPPPPPPWRSHLLQALFTTIAPPPTHRGPGDPFFSRNPSLPLGSSGKSVGFVWDRFEFLLIFWCLAYLPKYPGDSWILGFTAVAGGGRRIFCGLCGVFFFLPR